jgi:hypothetical protein
LIFKSELPAPEEFRTMLADAMSSANPVDDLLALSDQLREYERVHGLSSARFYQQYQAGTLDDNLQHCVEWAATYDLFLETKHRLELALMQAAIRSDLSEAA